MEKLKKVFTKNIPLKILSLVFAIVVWLLVVNIDNPTQSRNITSNVEVINSEILSAQGKYFTIPEGQNTVTFRVTAPRNIIEKLSSADFIATANMLNLEDDSRIPIEIVAKNYSDSLNISSQLRYLDVSVGDMMTEKYIITPQISGSPANGFKVENVELTPNVVTVSGPDTIVSKINKVVANLDVSGLSTNISESVLPVFIDTEGEKMDTTKLDVSISTITANVSLASIKEVPITLEGLDTVEDHFIDTATFTPEKIEIIGPSSILNNITEIKIPSSVIDLATLENNVTTTVDISQYLPEGVRLSDSRNAEVKVEIVLLNEEVREYEVPVSNIVVRNIDEGLEIKFDNENIPVSITGVTTILDEIKAEDITGSIDLEGLGLGTHTVRVVFDEDERYVISPVTLRIDLVDAETNENQGETE